MSSMWKRSFALFLCLVMCLSLFPVSAFAEEDIAEEPAVEDSVLDVPQDGIDVPTGDEVPENDPVILSDSEGSQPNEPAAEETDPAAEEPAGKEPVEIIISGDGEEPAEQPAEPTGEEEEDAADEPVRVVFVCEPEDLTLTVYVLDEEENKQIFEPEEDGSYLLLPGEYFYDAECEGYWGYSSELFSVDYRIEGEQRVTIHLFPFSPTDKVSVQFTCVPVEAKITVYDPSSLNEEGNPSVIEPEDNGQYLLLPGEYLFDAECPGWIPVSQALLIIEKTYLNVQFHVDLLESVDLIPAEMDSLNLEGNEVQALNVSSVTSLSCSSFISNAEHRQYIDQTMQYYLNSNSGMIDALNNGKSIIFMFEGGSDNYPGNSYSSSIRNQAVVIVVKNVNGAASIVFYSEDCSSIPDNPKHTDGSAYNYSTTILDGVYKAYTTNHLGQYGALNVRDTNGSSSFTGYYTPSSNPDGVYNGCSGINIHTRTSAYKSSDDSWHWSEGCQLIGAGNDSANEFNAFMKAVTGINYNVWTNYSSGSLSTIAAGQYVGYYVCNRYLAKNGLTAIYSSTAINNISASSTPSSYLSKCKSYPSFGKVTVTKDCNPYSLPCNSATAQKYNCTSTALTAKALKAGNKVTVTGIVYNTENHCWYKVDLDNNGSVAYLWADNVDLSTFSFAAPFVNNSSFPSSISGVQELSGAVLTGGSELKSIQGMVLNGNTTDTSKRSNVYTPEISCSGTEYWLKGSAVDNGLAFQDLTSGKYYTLVYVVKVQQYKITNTSQVPEAKTNTYTVKDKYFYFGSSQSDKCTVTLNANGGSCSTGSLSFNKGDSLGNLPDPTAPDAIAPYRFAGWYTAKSGGSKVDSSTVVNSSMTLYAHWIHDPFYSKITFELNGGSFTRLSGESSTTYKVKDYETGEEFTYNSYTEYLADNKYIYSAGPGGYYHELPVPTKAGCYFAGWTVGSTGVRIKWGHGYGGATLYAQWVDKSSAHATASTTYNGHTYEVFDYNMSWTDAKAFCEARGGHLVTITDSAEQNAVVNLIVNSGDTNGCHNGQYHIGATDAETEGTWKWVTGEAFSYNNWDPDAPEPNGGSSENYSAIMGKDNPNNKQVGDWLDNPNIGFGHFYSVCNTGFVCENDHAEYTVSYNANGGTGAPADQIKTHGTDLTLSSTKPTRASISAGSYTVTLNANGGSVTPTSLSAARTTSYSFKNWNTAQNGSGTVYSPSGKYTANADATLYAQWNSSTTTAAVTLPTPTRSGYSFQGWGTSSSASSGVTGSYTPIGNVTLYAVWTHDVIASGVFEGTSWVIDSGGTLTLSGTGPMANNAYMGSGNWTEYKSQYSKVVIEEGLTTVGSMAFMMGTNVKQVTLPESITCIEYAAFSNCKNLTEITIPSHVTEIQEAAFGGAKLTQITIPASVSVIGESAFSGNPLTSITFSGSAPEIGAKCFTKAEATVYFPANDASWTQSVRQNYGGTLNWVMYTQDGHRYPAPTWNWASNNGSATASFRCLDNDSTQTLNASVTSARTEPTHTKDGKIVYTARVTFLDAEYTSTKETVLPASGHSYGNPTWNWAADSSSATASFSCTGGDDTQTVDAVVTSARTEPTCTVAGSVAYTASVSFNGNSYTDRKTEAIPALGHSWGEWVVTTPATVDKDGVMTRTCSRCGAKETKPYSAETVTVTYNANGGSVSPASVKILKNGTIASLPTPTKTGSTFQGWFTAASGGTKVTTSTTFSANTTIYAQWKLIEYTVTFNDNGGTGGPGSQIKTHGTDLTLSSTKPTRANSSAGSYTVTLNANGGSVNPTILSAARTTSYSFKNWNTAQNGSGTPYNPSAKYTVDADVTLYAQWNSSTTTAAVTLPTPTRSGYSFQGWATSDTAASGVTGSYTPTGNVTLYAIWKADVVSDGTLTVGNAVSQPGKEVTVSVNLSANPGISLLGFFVEYDTDRLEFVGFEDGTLTGWLVSVGTQNKALWSSQSNSTKAGEVLKLRFKVLETAAEGEAKISLTRVEAITEKEDDVFFTPVDGAVTVRLKLSGDVNGDGVVNGKDVTRLTRYYAGLESNINMTNADVTGDGVVNGKDVTRLTRWYAGFDVELQ